MEALRWHRFLDDMAPQIFATPYGKPYLRNGLHFDIAHSFNKIVCVSRPSALVGIDIELIRPIGFPDFRDTMSHIQWQQIGISDNPFIQFWRHWTAKEAIVKADGRGIGFPLST